MKILERGGGSLARRFALAAAILSAVIIVLSSLLSYWLLSQQRSLALQALQAKEADFHVKAAGSSLQAIALRMADLAENPILATGLVDSVGRETYLTPFIQGVRQIDGIPIQVVLTDFQGEEIARNGMVDFSSDQLAWLHKQLESGTESAAIFPNEKGAELVAVELLRYSRTQTPEGAVLYKLSLDALRPALSARIAWKGMTPPPAAESRAKAVDIEVPPLFHGLGLQILEDPEELSSALGNPLPQTAIVVLALVLAAFVFTIALRLAETLTGDLRRLEEFSSSLSDEDLSERRADLSGSNEVSSLARAMNRMLDRLYRQQSQLKQENARFYALANTIPQLAWIAAPDGTVTWCNERWYAYTGNRPEQVLGRGWTSMHDSSRAVEVVMQWATARSAGTPMQATLTLRGADGIGRPFFVSVAPLHNEHGQIVQWFGTNTDLSPIMQAEEAVRRSEARLQQGLVAGNMAVWDWRLADGRVGYAANLQSVFGAAWEQVEQAWSQVLPEDLPALHEAINHAVQERGSYQVTVQIKRPDQELAWVELRGMVVAEAGQPAMMQAVAIDVSESKHAEEALQDADRRKDEFLAMLAHELRNPLAPISTAAQLLNMMFAAEPKVKQASDIIARQVGHMTRLVDELLDVSRVTRGLVTLKKEPLELGQVLSGAVDQTRPLIEARHHQLTVQPLAEPVTVLGDLTRLIQVLANLLGNAARYTREGGHIELTASVDSEWVCISVRDNGTGIDPALMPHVFELFTQGKRTPDRSQGGLGVGLALAKKLVELHGGTLQAFSGGVDQGSEFIVTLPRTRASGQADSAQAALVERSGDDLRILVVDDNVDAADTLVSMLQAVGYQVAVAYSAGEALRLAESQRPQVYLLDIGLPDMDGYELCRRLHEHDASGQARYIALTGYGQEQDIARSREAGFHHHFVKPVNTAQLLELLERRGK